MVVPGQDCNARLLDAKGTVIYDFHNANKGTTPCSLQVLNTGKVGIVDAQGTLWNLNGQPAPPTSNGSMLVGQTLTQVLHLICDQPDTHVPQGTAWACAAAGPLCSLLQS